MHRKSSSESSMHGAMASPILSSKFKNPPVRSNSATNLAALMNPNIQGTVPRSNSATSLIIDASPTSPPPVVEPTLPELVDQFYGYMNDCSELIGRKNGSKRSFVDIATAFAVAQDNLARAQEGTLDPESDLKTFYLLFTTTHQLLDAIIEARELDQAAWAWGIFGLSAGYTAPTPQALRDFTTLKTRLHDALKILPILEQRTRREQTQDSINLYTKKKGQVHICATLLLQTLKENEWEGVRAYHTICVADRWARNLRLVKAGR